MKVLNKIFVALLLSLLMVACIKPFNPDIRSEDLEKYVVTGQVTNGDGGQTINVSITSSISEPQYIPVVGCQGKIIDVLGNEFDLLDNENGDYTTWIDPQYLGSGAAFKIQITTPDGEKIESDFDQMPEIVAVDTVYFEVTKVYGYESGKTTDGIQFYLNLDGGNSSSRFYRWEAIETWEYHADYPVEWYYDGEVHHVVPPDYSRKVCWSTIKIAEIFTLSTNTLEANTYDRLPLHFVTNLSSRLAYGYSLLIKQYTHSETAYNYWDQMRINSSQEGGLYEKQPLTVKGNLRNISNPEKNVLGFFGVAAIDTKRMFISNVPGLPLDFETYCSPGVLRKGLIEITPEEYPGYLMGDDITWYPVLFNDECVNCLSLGGSNIKPVFWPN